MKNEKNINRRKKRSKKLLIILLSIVFCFSLFLNIYASVKRPAFGAQIVSYVHGDNFEFYEEYITYNGKRYVHDEMLTNYYFKGDIEKEVLTKLLIENKFWRSVLGNSKVYGFEYDEKRDFIYVESQDSYFFLISNLTFRSRDFVYPTIDKSEVEAFVYDYELNKEYIYKSIEDENEIQKILSQIVSTKTEICLKETSIDKSKDNYGDLFVYYKDSPLREYLGSIEKRGNDIYFVKADSE